ncbi:hypothetical protein AAFF_G00151330 [Aldrovandia affinis]|uniref:Uncharacterized protein n=1 Tax=Aldrovandia affinis TaxID=143900 RepID=A0AAD7W8D7_9TELE|nr:hypothetical protein AAFF_G00151330 [Aldrovandia affinis]
MELPNQDQQQRAHLQRERRFQLLLDEEVQARAEESANRKIWEKEVAIREKEAADTGSFNQSFLGVFGQLVQVLRGQHAQAQDKV